MSSIYRLSRTNTLSTGDVLALFSSQAGADRGVTVGEFVDYLNTVVGSPTSGVTQYFAPNATGFTVPLKPLTTGGNVDLLMTPASDLAAGTITLPEVSTTSDRQRITVSSVRAIASLTVAGNGAVVNGAPSALVANGFFTLRFDKVNSAWYRVA